METEGNPSKVKLYRMLAIIAAFLMALLWPVGAYFFWIFGGAAAYFLFMVWFYSPRIPKPTFNTGYDRWQSQQTTSPTVDWKRRIRIFVIIVAASFFFIVFALIMIGIFFGDPEATTENATTSAPPDKTVDALIDRGNELYNSGQRDSALIYYNWALEKEPENKFGLYNKALVYYSNGDYTTSISLSRKCLRSDNQYGYGYYLLGDNYLAVNKTDSAIYCFEKAYQNDVRDADMLQSMGDVYVDRSNRSKAIKFYLETIGQDSSRSEVYKKLADLDRSKASWYLKQAQKYN